MRETTWRFLFQEDLLLRPDDTARRRRLQRRLSRPLAATDRVLARALRREVLVQRVFVPAMNLVRKSGGVLPALCRLRGRHVGGMVRAWREGRRAK